MVDGMHAIHRSCQSKIASAMDGTNRSDPTILRSSSCHAPLLPMELSTAPTATQHLPNVTRRWHHQAASIPAAALPLSRPTHRPKAVDAPPPSSPTHNSSSASNSPRLAAARSASLSPPRAVMRSAPGHLASTRHCGIHLCLASTFAVGWKRAPPRARID
ncbi:hypothetical protein U9M48_024655 [Paspalum notatum var. saurae]|uniref:Uncharacterized protein n=1 Tax=Paspalum notatum var. saurae TaxID=547442 RepID=A0AAQ3TMQ7_PASNO